MLEKWKPPSLAEQFSNITSEPRKADTTGAHRNRGINTCLSPCLNGGQCLYPDTCNCSLYHATGSRCQTVPNKGSEREMTCRSWGQYNYETFDGLYYYFPGKCSYTLLRDCEDSTQSSVSIQVQNDPDCSLNAYSCTRSVSLFLPWEGEIRLQNFNASFKGQSLQLPHNIHDIELERISDYILVSQQQRFTLAWQGLSGSIYIKMSPEFVGRTCGLCGNFNADVQDDLKTSYGVFTDDIAMFGNSWIVEQPQKPCSILPSLFQSPCFALDLQIIQKVEEVCASLLKEPFQSCHEFVSPYSFMASCSNDLCLSDPSDDVVCQVFTEYARACAQSGHSLQDWRAHFPACGVYCPAELHHRECITCCPMQCNTEYVCIDSKLQCLDGCYCPDDLIYEDGMCVKPSDCPCEHHGMLYPSGHTIEEECNNCTCVGGVWNCTEHSCPGECSVTGDMYLQSFDGRIYTFPATCQYVLAKSRNSGEFIVTIQNAPCGPNLDGACIQSVSLVLNEDSRTEVTLSNSGEVFMAGQFRIFLPYSDDVFQIQELSSMFIQVKTAKGLRLQYNWKEFRLYLQLGELWRDDTWGLCGTFNGNIQDDFLAPSGMIESTPYLFGNSWRVSSACAPRPSLSQLDPCDTHQQAASYAVTKCEVLMQETFSVCHEHVSPVAFYLQCRADVCRCGTPCLCSALAHYARACRKHSVIIEFRSHMPECAVACPPTMEYGICVSSCERHCLYLSKPQSCGEECEEGCVCPEGTYYSTHTHTCVQRSECPCFFQGADFSPGDVIMTSSDIQICQDGKIVSQSIITDKLCPPGQVYEDCGMRGNGLLASKGLACVHTCESYLLNLTCSSHEPCVPGCICPPGLLRHSDECFEPGACPCSWKGKEYYPGEKVSSPCHLCVCQHGSFQCEFHPCASMCTIYGDRHYRTFDGLLFDYIGDCKVFLLKSSADVTMSVRAKNVDCFESGVICRKTLLISIGQSFIAFDDESGKPNPVSTIDRQNVFIWSAGYLTIIHLIQYEISVFWDRKTTIHIQAGPRWQGKLSGLCGNFDLKTANEMRTPDNMESSTPQEFGNSWIATECVNNPDIRHPCILNPLREPFAKRRCGILLSDVFQACHPVVDVTWFYTNCLADTCSCTRGGDCECLCTSLAAYSQHCCQQGITIDWRSPSLCPYDCEYYNKVLGKGPMRLIPYKENSVVLAVNRTSGLLFSKRGVINADGVVTLFMMTPGLSKTRPHDSSLVSFEAADRPNYFLIAEHTGQLKLSKWEERRAFWDAATFILHRDTWISGFDSLESLMWPGFFLHYMLSKLQLLKYNHLARYRRATLFKLSSSTTGSMRTVCQWKYESCINPCFRTCSDPAALRCVTILKAEGCLPQCPDHMVLDEITQRCVFLEDCIKLPVILPEPTTSAATSSAATSSAAVTSPTSLPSAAVSTGRIPAVDALNTTIPHTMTSSSEPSSPATSTVTTQTLPLLANPSASPTISVEQGTVTTSDTPASFTKQVVNTSKSTGMPTTVFSTTPVTLGTKTAFVSALPTETTKTLHSAITTSLSTSTSSFAALSTAMPISLEKQPTTESALPIKSVITTEGTTESMSPSSRELIFDTTTIKPATLLHPSTTVDKTTQTTAFSTASTETESIAPALDLITSATTANPTVTAPSQTFTSIQLHPTSHSGISTQKTTLVHGTETRQPSLVHTREKDIPTSPTAQKISTTYLPVNPTETSNKLPSVSTSRTEEQTVTYKVITEMVSQPTKILNVPSTFSTAEGVELTATTTAEIVPGPNTTHTTFWSAGVLPSQATSTTQLAFTQPVPSERALTTSKAIVTETVTRSTPVSHITTQTMIFPSTTTHITTFPTVHNLLTHTTSRTSFPLVINSSVFTATTSGSTESLLSTLKASSTSAHFTDRTTISKTQSPSTSPSTSPTTAMTESKTTEVDHAYTPMPSAVTTSKLSSAAVSETQTVSTATSSTAEPQSTTSTAMNMFTSHTTFSSVTSHPETEITDFPPHTGRSELSTTTSTQPSWSFVPSGSEITPSTESVTKKVTPLMISASPLSTLRTPEITTTTHALPPAVTETPVTVTDKMQVTTQPWNTTKTDSQTSSSGSFPSSTITNTQPQNMTEYMTDKGSTLTPTSKRIDTSTTDASHVSNGTADFTSTSSRWPLLGEPTYTISERSPSPDNWKTASSPSTTLPYITEAKHWAVEDTHTTVLSTSAKDDYPSNVCTPPYSEVVDECTKLICVNGRMLLFNKSQSCPYASNPPNCGLLGFAVLVSGDKCCPKWDCPCRCSVFPDLNVITFDGNNVAVYKAATYVVAQFQNETISILVQDCHNSDNKHVWNFTHLCLAALNITHDLNHVVINRLQRNLYVNSRFAKPRFKKYGFEVLDTGNMYLIWTPAGLKIQWFHSTGMLVIEREMHTNKVFTMGLCGCCDGNSLNDFTMANGTVLAGNEDPALFIDSWQVGNTTSYISQSRRREVNCSTSDCSDCLKMLNNLTFQACHRYVPPTAFCEVWVRDAEYVNNPCVALAAYVASCYKFNICIEWRNPNFCPFVCPETLQYQACLPACTAPSCPNQEFEYDADTCSGLTEGCVCPEGTLLHRPYSSLCISPNKCACTDSFGTPHALGEIWKASVDGCCMYRCESDGIVPVEFDCSDVPQPICTRAGEVSISLADDNSCCPQRVCVCNQSVCEAAPLECKFGQKLVSYFRHDSCCPEYTCECDSDQCVLDVPVCREDQKLIATFAEGSCCLAHICMCDVCSEELPKCEEGELLTVDANSTDRCCPIYHCLCEPSRCSAITCPVGMVPISTVVPGQCCPLQACECSCEKITRPKCSLGESLQLDRAFVVDPENHCGCKRYNCVRNAVCLDGERGVMRPGQTIIEQNAVGVCHTTRCTHTFDSATGFYLIKATSINCTSQCQPYQVYVPSKDQSSCCGVCKNVSCVHYSDNGSLTYKPGKSWVDDCMHYDCVDTKSGPVLVSYPYSCPPFNETECMKIGGTTVTYMDGCCKTCTGYSVYPFPVSTLKPTISTNCERGKEDGKSCQKVTVRMTIRKNDCRSNRPVNIVSCDGKCPSASIYNYNINTYARFCKCCREMGLQRRSVQLYCSSNSTWVNYSIQEPTDCSCQWS
ncbi:otogelin [Trichomycterus rosablanca]|uniref:otogelin n=1 Tax=Trichomycterus rosablanca TaxID=2290929 RepID=UPI002F35FC68